MTRRLQDKICALTGAGAGIGKAATELFAAQGARVLLLDRNPGTGRAIEETIRAKGGHAGFVALDIADPENVRHVFEEI